jgi:hypothetical protein
MEGFTMLRSPLCLVALLMAMLAFTPGAEATLATCTSPCAVPYLSGGIGVDERFEMLTRQHEFNLRVLTAGSPTGHYLNVDRIRVVDEYGTAILDIAPDGPWLYARLAPGKYAVSATYAGQTQSRRIEMPAEGHREVYFYWPGPGPATN